MGSECFNCKAATNDDDFCHGCRESVCNDCSKNDELMGEHNPEDHLAEPGDDE